MLARRVIACLDVRAGRVVKGTAFVDLRDAGDPAELAERYEEGGADEIVLLDVAATPEERATVLDVARRAADRLSIPLTIGGGIRTVEGVARTLRAGADKIALNSAAVARPELVAECAARFGAQAVVISVDARRNGNGWRAFTHGGRRDTGLDVVEWAGRCEELGAGEVLLTSIDRDGTRQGYDLDLVREVAQRVAVPVIASGGAGCAEHVGDVLAHTAASAALLAGVLHEGLVTIGAVKRHLFARDIPVRMTANV